MIEIDYSADFTVLGDCDLSNQCDRVMSELVGLDKADCGIHDPAVSLDSKSGVITIEVVSFGVDIDAATAEADSCIRTAIHATGGATPNWAFSKRAQRVSLV